MLLLKEDFIVDEIQVEQTKMLLVRWLYRGLDKSGANKTKCYC